MMIAKLMGLDAGLRDECRAHPKDVRCRFPEGPRFWRKFDIYLVASNFLSSANRKSLNAIFAKMLVFSR